MRDASMSSVNATPQLLEELRDISRRLASLASRPNDHDLDPDAIVDLNLARESVDKLINRIERLLE